MSHRRISLFTLVLVVCLGLPAAARACLWDSDTLAAEAKGVPGVVDIIVGRFERNPPLYYEMRLKRITKRRDAEASTLTLEDHDDAAVACDRLGQGDEAIKWMAAKKARLDAMDPGRDEHREHLYRYHANLGTFHAHRWLGNGANRGDMTDMNLAEEHIAKAIEINPDAHFGREKYQLLAIRWILDPPASDSSRLPTLFDRSDIVAVSTNRGYVFEGDEDHAIEGLSGLIALGNAWESVDIYRALAVALRSQEHASLLLLANLRVEELIANGRTTLYPLEEGAELEHYLFQMIGGASYEHEEIEQFYKDARGEAKGWHEERETFMVAQLKQGLHPDTHGADFWRGYEASTTQPNMPGGLLG